MKMPNIYTYIISRVLVFVNTRTDDYYKSEFGKHCCAKSASNTNPKHYFTSFTSIFFKSA